ncbi:MAG: SUMF1/EgtB/PvdO family nonheme iron enzyme, partial [Planctomycetales bacterium]
MRIPSAIVLYLLAAAPATVFGQNRKTVDFATHIQPIIESTCLNCHNEKNAEGELRLDSLAAAIRGGENGPAIVPGQPSKSPFYATLVLPRDDDAIMPPEGLPLAKSQADLIKTWIAEGAAWPVAIKLKTQPRIDFVKHVQPILEQNCLSCHQTKNAEGDYDLSTRSAAFASGENAPAIVPFHPGKSDLYALAVLARDEERLMPPVDQGGPLAKTLTEPLRLWIAQGAVWPRDLILKPKAKTPRRDKTPDNPELLKKIHALIVKREKESPVDLKNYSAKVPQTGAAYQMVAVRGGEFLMGSPEKEAHRKKNEGPQKKVRVDSFWIGKYEMTWDEYEPFMITQVDRAKHGGRTDYDPAVHGIADAVSQPTPPYVEMSFGMGQLGYPAVS